MNTFPKMHVSLYVAEIDRTVEFYEKMFNQRADKVKPGYAKFMLDDPSLVISFVQNDSKVQPKFGHLGIQVQKESQVFDQLERLNSEGVKTKEEMGVQCCYAKQDKFWVSDPDGHQWEFYYFQEDVEFNDPHYAMKNPAAIVEEGVEGKEESCCEPGSGCC